MKNQLKSLIQISTIPFLISCAGKSSNPLEDKKDLKTGPITSRQSETQKILGSDIFAIEIVGTNEKNSGNFIEGQEGEALIQVDLKTKSASAYSIQLVNFEMPDAPSIEKTNVPNQFKLHWKPPVGTIPSDKPYLVLNAQIQVTITQSEEKLLVGTTKTKTLPIYVNKFGAQPSLTGTSDFSGGVEEGVDKAVTFDVEDPGTQYGNGGVPELLITPYMYSNTEAYYVNAARYLVPDDSKPTNPQKISATKWRFFYLLQVDHLPLDRDRSGKEMPSASSVKLSFNVRVLSVLGTLSGARKIETVARYTAQPPSLALGSSVTEVKAGIESVITVKYSSAHPLSVVSVKTPSQQIASLSGKKEISCAYDVADRMNSGVCTIKWTPSCLKEPKKISLSLKVDGTINSKIKSSILNQEITVSPNPEVCSVVATTGVKK